MKITVSVPKEIEVDIINQKLITLQYLRNLFQWKPEDYVCLKTSVLMRRKTYHSSHSWSEEVAVRAATQEEVALQTVFDYLNNKAL